MVIGAGVFDIYLGQGWIPEFKRKTGDLDLSIGLLNDSSDYKTVREALLGFSYTQPDTELKYRFFPPQKAIPGAIAYVDLLAHPLTSEVTAAQARATMGAGPEFSFGAINFALKESFKIEQKIFFPNPIAFIALKIRSYEDESNKRLKDLADIAELVWGLVERGTHFKMADLWKKIESDPEAGYVCRMLSDLGSGNSPKWDLEDIRSELRGRLFSNTEIDEVIPQRLKELVEYLR